MDCRTSNDGNADIGTGQEYSAKKAVISMFWASQIMRDRLESHSFSNKKEKEWLTVVFT